MVDVEKVLYDLAYSIVDFKEALAVKELESINDNEIILMIYAKNDDIGRLIGKKGSMANALRQVMGISSRLLNKRIQLKFEAIE
ncbi:MAG TPA: KH domain-containing protein [Erysipelothrix sp.]|jgi:predicted RNA-binding protein YlqC (UPF0109 family)|nr:KH domain-containing protein [Erysipelothrix sp.]